MRVYNRPFSDTKGEKTVPYLLAIEYDKEHDFFYKIDIKRGTFCYTFKKFFCFVRGMGSSTIKVTI